MIRSGDGRPPAMDTAVLEVVRRRTESTRVEIARELGVTAATVTNSVKRLLAAGLLWESGHARSTGGKRATLLRVNDAARRALGCTIDHDRLSMVAVDTTGALQSRVVLPLVDAADPHEVSESVREGLAALIPDDELGAMTGIGFAMPAQLPAEVDQALRALTAELDVRATRGREGTCAALGSFWSGEQSGAGLSGTVHLGSTTTLSLLLDGVPFRPDSGQSLDHLRVDPEGPICACGRRGCLHLSVAPDGVDGLSRTALEATQGSATAQADVLAAALPLTRIAANLAIALGLDTMVLAGTPVQAAPAIYLQAAREHFGDETTTRVVVSQVQPHPCAVGAAVLALQAFLDTGGR
ncbi:MAG: ROK family transcriptional regulator [Brachybacterium sp.]|uniref:ROK family transcriptional regulator n=1 Tax=Brachybacterium sp. TaxID=1891286 RepID=UPI0026494752|nr:ROK family transcriptional regulator [Brachybacterium sp.]MDN5687108.1 ROK family transcriptional regulator [Brachybacterium sp.]